MGFAQVGPDLHLDFGDVVSALMREGKTSIAVWMARVMGEMMMRSGTAGRVMDFAASSPRVVRGGSRKGESR